MLSERAKSTRAAWSQAATQRKLSAAARGRSAKTAPRMLVRVRSRSLNPFMHVRQHCGSFLQLRSISIAHKRASVWADWISHRIEERVVDYA
jgi:hypothetical protein